MNVPKLRFKEFDGEWEEKKLEEISEKLTRKNKELKVTNVISNSASQGLVSQRAYFEKDIANKDNIDGYYIISKGDFVYNPRISKEAPYGPISIYHDNEDGIVSPLYTCFRILKESAFPIYLYYFFKSTSWHKYIYKNGDSGARHDRVSIKDATFFKLPVKLSTLEEQKKIGTFFEVMDKKIQLQQQKIDLLQEQKKGYMQKIFKQELRFTDNNGKAYFEWKYIKLGALTNKTGKKNKDGFKYPVASVNNKTGCRINGEKNNSNADVDISAYKIVYKDEFVYNPSRINVGSYGYQNLVEKAIVSSLYVVFETKEELLNEYLKIYMDTVYFNNEVRRNTEGSVREYLFYENFSNIKIPLPSIEEQKKIADFLGRLDNKINLEEAKLKALQKQKQGFMQQMFI